MTIPKKAEMIGIEVMLGKRRPNALPLTCGTRE
jgi:hypothetical protein